jgi:golgi phosphoprotein 3
MTKTENSNNLSFAEKIVLLALNDNGWFGNSEQRIKFGLAGAVLYELEKAQEIKFNCDCIEVIGTKETGNDVLDSALMILRKSKKRLTLNKAIQKIVYKSGLRWKSLLKDLIKKNILKKEAYRFLWLFYQDKYPVCDTEIKKQMLADLYLKLKGEKELTADDLMLLSIMRTCRMIDKNFLLQEHFLKIRLKIKEITEFTKPSTDIERKIKLIKEAIQKAVFASNITLHI